MLNESATSSRQPMAMAQLYAAWRSMRESEPNLRARDLAEKLGVSEAELVASRCGDGVVRLQGSWADLIRELPAVGRVMVLTRNDSCVHEKKGNFDHVDLGEVMGVVLNDAIDLRIFLNHWKYGFAVHEASHGRMLHSLQFFDGDGRAVHKVYRTDTTDVDAWTHLVRRHGAAVQSPLLDIRPVADPLPRLLDDEAVDVEALRTGWREMRDPHDFFALLRRRKVTRLQALHVVGDEFARRVDSAAARTVLDSAADSGLPIMVFTGSPGVVQIHTGPVHNVKMAGSWLNVLDADFNLHLRTDHVAESWVVKKPTPDGPVTSVELYDAHGAQIVQFFGERKPGKPELPGWRALADGLAATVAGHA